MKKFLKIVGGIFLMFILIGVIAGAMSEDSASNEPVKEVVADGTDRAEPAQEVEKAAEPKKEKEGPKEEVKEEKAPEPKEEKKEEPKKEEPKTTLAQQNAVKAAEGYLNFTAFSKTGLVEQLEFDGYENADAVYAVENITVDWNEQAVKSAQSYLDFTSFSRQGLIDQLVFDGYTQDQATHAVNEIGL